MYNVVILGNAKIPQNLKCFVRVYQIRETTRVGGTLYPVSSLLQSQGRRLPTSHFSSKGPKGLVSDENKIM